MQNIPMLDPSPVFGGFISHKANQSKIWQEYVEQKSLTHECMDAMKSMT